jgi:uncharacterized spore protein YtfJ
MLGGRSGLCSTKGTGNAGGNRVEKVTVIVLESDGHGVIAENKRMRSNMGVLQVATQERDLIVMRCLAYEIRRKSEAQELNYMRIFKETSARVGCTSALVEMCE